MSFYFSSDGSLKYTTNQVAAKGITTNSSSSASSSSKFSTAMKNSALNKSGKLNSNDKNTILANNKDYQMFAKFQARINKIASTKPRTFDGTENSTMNLSAITNYSSALEKQAKTKKSS